MGENNDLEYLRRQLAAAEKQIGELRDDKIEQISDRVDKNFSEGKAQADQHERRIIQLEHENFRMAGQRAVFGKIIPVTSIVISGVLLVLKVLEFWKAR